MGRGQPGSDVMPKILRLLCLLAVQEKVTTKTKSNTKQEKNVQLT